MHWSRSVTCRGMSAVFGLLVLPAFGAEDTPRPGFRTRSHSVHAAREPETNAIFGPPAPVETSKIPAPKSDENARLSPERERARQQAHALLRHLTTGHLRLTNPDRDSAQLRRLEQEGVYLWPPASRQAIASSSYVPVGPLDPVYKRPPSRHLPAGRADLTEKSLPALPPAETPPPSPALMQMLLTLAERATPNRPLEILSFLRPPYRTAYWRHGGPNTMHAHGLAVDIGAYGGYRIRLDRPEECVQMTLSLLSDLPPGRYRLGLPKAPEVPLVVGQPLSSVALANLKMSLSASVFAAFPRRGLPSRRATQIVPTPSALSFEAAPTIPNLGVNGAALGIDLGRPEKPWPFFPAPEPELKNGVVAPLMRNGKVVLDASGRPQPHLVRFRNTGYAPVDAIADPRVQLAILTARQRGVVITAQFPDAADHIHVDMKPDP